MSKNEAFFLYNICYSSAEELTESKKTRQGVKMEERVVMRKLRCLQWKHVSMAYKTYYYMEYVNVSHANPEEEDNWPDQDKIVAFIQLCFVLARTQWENGVYLEESLGGSEGT